MNINPDGSYSSGPAKKPDGGSFGGPGRKPLPKLSLNLPGRAAILALILVLLALMVLDAFYTLKEDQYAVITTFGKPTMVSTSGLKLKLPFIQQVTKVTKTIQGFPLGYRIGSTRAWTRSPDDHLRL